MDNHGTLVAYQVARPGYIAFAVDQGDGYAIWGINRYGEEEGIGDAESLEEAMQVMEQEARQIRANAGLELEEPVPVVLDEPINASHPGYLDELVEASLAEAEQTDPRAQRAAGIRAREGVPAGECLAELGHDPVGCDCFICSQ